MTNIKMTLKIPVSVKKNENWYVSCCPVLNVFSQGKTEKKAKENLADALYLFLTSCLERGVLDEVLKESGFKKVSKKVGTSPKNEDYIDIPLNLLSQKTAPKFCHA